MAQANLSEVMAEARDNKSAISRLSVLIVDDHPLFCDALTLTLKLGLRIEQVSTTGLLARAIEIVHESPPSIILLDLNLPDTQGLDGLIRLRKAAGSVPIIVVSSLSENRVVASTIEAGASGFVPKHSQREVFLEAFSKIMDGETFVPEGFMLPSNDSEPQSDQAEAIRRISELTQQQTRILELLCEGKLNKQIAYDLGIAVTTVKSHVTVILRKLGVQSRTQAVLLAQSAKYSNILQGSELLDQ